MTLNMTAILRGVRDQELIITPRVNDWLMQHGDDPLSDRVADIIRDQLRTKPRDRTASFSGSSAGQCYRYQELAFLGMPRMGAISPRLQLIFNDGTWRHLRWQAMLLEAGILDRIEVPLWWRRMKSRGTMDGVGTVHDEHPRTALHGMEFGFELKGINPYGYAAAVKRDEAMKEEHENQVARYFLLGGYTLWVTVYENKACVPENTRCLTKRGWTHHNDLRDDDCIMTYNIQRDEMEWEPYQGKAVYEQDDHPLWRVGNKHQEFLCTKEHTWPVRDQQGRMSIRRTDQLNSNSWVPFVAPYRSDKATVGIETAEWLGWFASDGTITKTRWPSYLIRVKRQRKIDSLRQIKMLTESGPWNDYYEYRVPSGPELDRVRALLPSKASLPGLVASMSTDELNAFLVGALGGDGSWSSTGTGVQFTQNDGPVKEAVQIASTLLGHRMNVNKDRLSAYPGTRQWMRTYAPIMVPHYSRVWCPKTTNGFWLMEQDGKAVLTGNTQEWFEWVSFPDQERMDAQREELEELNYAIDNKQLHDMLPQCRIRTGAFKECDFGMTAQGACPRAGDWPNLKRLK